MKFLTLLLVSVPLWLSAQSPEGIRAFRGGIKIPTELYVSSNLAPIYIGEYSLGFNYSNHKHLSYNLSFGYAPEPKYGSLYKLERLEPFDAGDGSFVKIGVDYYIKEKTIFSKRSSKLINPYLGARITGSRIHEVYLESLLDSSAEDVYSMNYGAALALGNKIHIKNRFSLRLGLQVGTDLIQNRKYQKHGYTPGLGIYWGAFRTQFVGELNFLIHRGIKRRANKTYSKR